MKVNFWPKLLVGLWLTGVLLQPMALAETKAKPIFIRTCISQFEQAHPRNSEAVNFSQQWAWGTGEAATQTFVWYAWSDEEGFIFFALEVALDSADLQQLFAGPDTRYVYWTIANGRGIYANASGQTVVRATNEWIDLCRLSQQMTCQQYLGECLEFMAVRTSIDHFAVAEYFTDCK